MQSLDIRKSADLLIEKHGRNAPKIAESMADARRDAKDYQGCAIWLGVLEAINRLTADKKPEQGREISGDSSRRGG